VPENLIIMTSGIRQFVGKDRHVVEVTCVSQKQAAHADIILNTPAGLESGATFQFVFVTDGTTQATSTSIGSYNNFVSTQAGLEANGTVYYNGTPVTFNAIGSTPTINAYANIGGMSATTSVYLANGTLVAQNTTTSCKAPGTSASRLCCHHPAAYAARLANQHLSFQAAALRAARRSLNH